MNVYEMYRANGNRFGFTVKRDSWRNLTAKVVSIEGVTEGQEIPGKPPYFNKQDVKAVLSGPGCNSNVAVSLSCPGNYTYQLVK